MPPSPAEYPHAPYPGEAPPRQRIGRYAVVNGILIGACVLVAIYTQLGENQRRILPFFISEWPASEPQGLIEVRHGEWWRLFAPAFLHFGVVHIVFNMMAMVNLGGPIERVEGPWFYGMFCALTAVCSDLAQYYYTGSPAFGGMSGVIFGLFGYLWLRALVDKTYILRLQRQSIITTLVFFAVCFTGILPIANAAHTAGLAIGVIWGIASGLAAKSRGTHVEAPPPFMN